MIKLLKPKIAAYCFTPKDIPITPEGVIELIGRANYQRPEKDPEPFVSMIYKQGHHTLLEFSLIVANIICDRGVSHELVRHRLASFNQESTRYVDYRSEMTFIIPLGVNIEQDYLSLAEARNMAKKMEDSHDRDWLLRRIKNYEDYYMDRNVWKKQAQEAREGLPMCLKTELYVGANLREWLHIFELRMSDKAHPEMRRIMVPLFRAVMANFPILSKRVQNLNLLAEEWEVNHAG